MESWDLGEVIADLIHVAVGVSSRSATALEEGVPRGAAGAEAGAAPDPQTVLRALIDRRGNEARVMGEALARRVLVETLGSKEVRLALVALRRGPDADHRLVALCEALPVAQAARRER